jgi:hypothetical protein
MGPKASLHNFFVLFVSFALFVVEGFAFKDLGEVWAAAGGAASVQALVEKDSVSLGEPFVLQVRTEGGDIAPGTEPPDMSAVSDFSVEYLGGQSNNSSSITIINGKVNKVESFGHTYSYRLTPQKTGVLGIPSIAVPLDAGKSKILHTTPVTIRVTEPEATDEFHLELKFSKTRFYVGEPVMLTAVWYIGRNVDSVHFNLPILQDQTFAFVDPKTDQDPRKQYFQVPVGGATVLAEKGTGVHSGREYTTLTFRKVMFARQPGSFETPEATVSCRTLAGYARQQQRRSPFDGFFGDDFFNPGRQGIYKTVVTRSPQVVLTALALPEEGKPLNFSGWVGRFQVEASASPTDVNVGDPITLAVSVTGPEYLENVALPPLVKDSQLQKDFKVPEEMAAGVTRGNARQFTQTLRPKSADVTAIPPLSFPYFNPDVGRYETVQSKPIPLTVKPAKVLTSADVEGKSGGSAVRKNELENWSKGIAYNYEGPEVLERQVYRVSDTVGSPLWLAVTLIPFLCFVTLLTSFRIRQRQLADPDGLKYRKALSRFTKKAHAIGAEGLADANACDVLLEAMRAYLGDKLKRDGPSLTYMDIEDKLKGRGVNTQLAERLRGLFDSCEQGSYGGVDLVRPVDELLKEALEVIKTLDRVM